jgi:hypothetical protein
MTNLICESCSQPKNALKRVPSQLIAKQLIMCDECIKFKYEPRYVVALACIAGNEDAHVFVKNNRYVGQPLELREVL